MSQFLVPYLVVDVLAFPPCSVEGEREDSLEIDTDTERDREAIMAALVEEICTVLRVGADASVQESSTSTSGSDAGAASGVASASLVSSIRPSRLSRGMLDRVAIAGFRSTDNASSHMSVHAVFTLLDTLGVWSNFAKMKATKGKKFIYAQYLDCGRKPALTFLAQTRVPLQCTGPPRRCGRARLGRTWRSSSTPSPRHYWDTPQCA
jgi:hypothetical protein